MVTAENIQSDVYPPLPLKATGHCWICGSSRLKVVWIDVADFQWTPTLAPYNHTHHNPVELARCEDCGFGQPFKEPDVENFYDRLYYREWTESDLEKDFESTYRDVIYQDILAELDRLVPRDHRKLIDIGAHTGRFAWLAHKAGWDAEAIEINKVTASFAARRTGLAIHSQKAEDLASTGRRYNAATLNDVLEHLPEPLPIVRGIAQILEPGGILSIKVPHGPMQRVKEGFRIKVLRRDPLLQRAGVMINYVHVNHFSVKSLRLCLEKAGFKVLKIRPGRSETFGWKESGLVRSLTVRSFDMAGRIIPGAVHTPLAMNLQAFAVKL